MDACVLPCRVINSFNAPSAHAQDAPAPNRAALDEAFQELLSKISDEDDEWVVLVGEVQELRTSQSISQIEPHL